MNEPWLDWAIEIQSIAQTGLFYAHDEFDRERYQRLRDIAAEMLSCKTDVSMEKVKNLFCCEEGYQTPKIDTRAAVFQDGKILLVHEKNDTWALPGGWCDVDQSIATNTIKEVREEAGLIVSTDKLIAVQDWRKHNATNFAFGILKAFVLCKVIGGKFRKNIETSEICYFEKNALPENLAVEKTTKDQILMCFEASENPEWKTQFD